MAAGGSLAAIWRLVLAASWLLSGRYDVACGSLCFRKGTVLPNMINCADAVAGHRFSVGINDRYAVIVTG